MINESNNKGLPDDNNFKGPVSDLIKMIRACEKLGINPRDVMNLLRRPNLEEVLKELNEFSINKTKAQRELEKKLAREQRASDFGIGE